MPINPREFLVTARTLNSNQGIGFSEAVYRTAVGRAYYAAFLEAREKASLGHVRSDSHKVVIDHYNSLSTNTAGPQIANKLRSLSAKRKDADYELSRSFSGREATAAIKTSESIFKALDTLE